MTLDLILFAFAVGVGLALLIRFVVWVLSVEIEDGDMDDGLDGWQEPKGKR